MSRRTRVLGLVLVALAGCACTGCVNPQARLQMAEDAEAKKDLSVKTVGDIADIRAAGPVQVSGFGVVSGLDGTGGTPPGPYRQALEQLLRKQKIEHVQEILDSPDNAMVVVNAFIPPGARRGDKIDVEVTLPPGSKATSLAGGFLQLCALRNHDSTKGVAPGYDGPDRALAGHIMARARGAVLVGLGEGDAPAEQKRGRVWRGGVTLIDLPYYAQLRRDDKSTRVAYAVAERLNFLFQEDPARLQRLSQQAKQLFVLDDVAQQINHSLTPGPEAGKVAHVQGKELVELRVPYSYRLNHDRYVYVAHLLPLAEEAEQQARYRRRLQKLLADPAETVMAARRLEALGRDSLPMLRQGLTHEHPLVRFACAEALAYLGDGSGTDVLAKLAVEHPLLAGSCLTALASLDEPGCRQRLAELLRDTDPVLRSGAFSALRQLAEHDLPEPGLKAPGGEPYREWLHRHLGGELLGGSFWLHRVAGGTQRLVAFAGDTRAEVVLFGDGIALAAPVRLLAGPGQEFALTFEPGADRCTVSRISARLGKRQKLCPPTLEEILRAMAELGGDYPDVIDLIHKLDERGGLNAAVRLNTAPPEVTVQMLAEWGRTPAAH
jgi:Flagellar P-ring protein